jgi:hypothetical protein
MFIRKECVTESHNLKLNMSSMDLVADKWLEKSSKVCVIIHK